jgi:hypothetical protein
MHAWLFTVFRHWFWSCFRMAVLWDFSWAHLIVIFFYFSLFSCFLPNSLPHSLYRFSHSLNPKEKISTLRSAFMLHLLLAVSTLKGGQYQQHDIWLHSLTRIVSMSQYGLLARCPAFCPTGRVIRPVGKCWHQSTSHISEDNPLFSHGESRDLSWRG